MPKTMPVGGGGNKFALIPEGISRAVCAEVVGPFIDKTPWGLKEQGFLVFQSEHLVEDVDSDYHGKRITARYYFNWTWGTEEYPSNIRKLVESWRDRAMTDEEFFDFDMETLQGKPCKLLVSHEPKKGGGKKQVLTVKPPGDRDSWVGISDDYEPVAEKEAKKREAADEVPTIDDVSGVPF